MLSSGRPTMVLTGVDERTITKRAEGEQTFVCKNSEGVVRSWFQNDTTRKRCGNHRYPYERLP